MSAPRSTGDSQRARSGEALADFTMPATDVSRDDQVVIVETFIDVLNGLYVHLPLKRAMHGIDPVQQLRRLLDRVRRGLDEAAFHAEMSRIVTSMRDAHTSYVGPAKLGGVVAILPFLVEEYSEDGERRYLVSKTSEGGVEDDAFAEGVEVITWNGSPIAAAIARHADRERGGRPDSARARAVESLTFRPLRYGPKPDEEWVDVRYRAGDDTVREIRIPWRVIRPLSSGQVPHPTSPEAMASALYPDRAAVRRAKKALFKHDLWMSELVDATHAARLGNPDEGWISGRFQDAVSAKTITTPDGKFGYLRLWSFDVLDDVAFVDEVVELLALLPQRGLVIDLRGNPGGLIWAAERLLQLFTPHDVEPTRFSLVATDLTRALAGARRNERTLGPWQKSLNDAVATGELYSQAVPITPVERCNDVGQVYGGPVVAVVDATSYSAADLFAAGFADNGIGTIVGIGEATGAGGANVWRADAVAVALSTTTHAIRALPHGYSFTVSVRRATRIGAAAGTPIEDVGVAGHRHHTMTKRDLLDHNADLFAACGRLLAAEPRSGLAIEWARPVLAIRTESLDRIDVYLDDRPYTTLDVLADGTTTLELPDPEIIRVEGFRGQNLRQSRIYHNAMD